MILKIFTDGGSLNNPGEAAIGYLIYLDKKLLKKHGARIGIASNNVAEYTALVEALTEVKKLLPTMPEKPEKIQCTADSSLIVNQLNGLYKIKHPDMRRLLFQVRILEGEIKIPISYNHVLRHKNAEADALVKEALGK